MDGAATELWLLRGDRMAYLSSLVSQGARQAIPWCWTVTRSSYMRYPPGYINGDMIILKETQPQMGLLLEKVFHVQLPVIKPLNKQQTMRGWIRWHLITDGCHTLDGHSTRLLLHNKEVLKGSMHNSEHRASSQIPCDLDTLSNELVNNRTEQVASPGVTKKLEFPELRRNRTWPAWKKGY